MKDYILIQECIQAYQAECDEAFAVQRSENKECSVCLEKVWERDGDKRFGILENCDHVFCLDCIRKWRAASSYDNRVVKAWYICFYYPSFEEYLENFHINL